MDTDTFSLSASESLQSVSNQDVSIIPTIPAMCPFTSIDAIQSRQSLDVNHLLHVFLGHRQTQIGLLIHLEMLRMEHKHSISVLLNHAQGFVNQAL